MENLKDIILSEEEIREFHKKGFIVIENAFSADEINHFKDHISSVYETSKEFKETCIHNNSRFVYQDSHLHRVVWCGGQSKELLNMSHDMRITVPVSQLLESEEMDHLINQIHFKMPGDNVSFPLHQDCENRGLGTSNWSDINGKGSYVQTVLSIDEMNDENGPLLLLPNSPGLGPLNLKNGGEYPIDESKLFRLHMKPGSIAMFGPMTVHGSKPNLSSEARRVLINGFAYPGANNKSYPGCDKGLRIKIKQAS